MTERVRSVQTTGKEKVDRKTHLETSKNIANYKNGIVTKINFPFTSKIYFSPKPRLEWSLLFYSLFTMTIKRMNAALSDKFWHTWPQPPPCKKGHVHPLPRPCNVHQHSPRKNVKTYAQYYYFYAQVV